MFYEGFDVSPKMESQSYLSKMKQNNATEFAGYSFHNINGKKDFPDPLDPESLIASGFSMGNRYLFGLSYTDIDPEDISGLSGGTKALNRYEKGGFKLYEIIG